MKIKFKLLYLVVLATVMLSLFCMTVSASDSESVLGDMNGDSVVNIDDAIYLLKHTMLPSRYPLSQSADVNGSEDVNIDDAIYLLKHTMMPSRYPLLNVKQYTVTWKNDNGTLLKTTRVEENKMPSFGDSVPTKASDSLYDYTFSHWATEFEAVTEDVTYVAIYTKTNRTSYTISYDANGGTDAPFSQSKSKGASITLTSSVPTYEGKDFVGWICANDSKIYKSGASFNIDADVTLYAVWGHNCSTCSGNGTTPTTIYCSRCDGKGYTTSGEYYFVDCTYKNCSNGKIWVDVKCYSCKAAGGLATAHCTACDGAGYILERDTCPNCNGEAGFYKPDTTKYRCQTCESGKVSSTQTCTTCNGDKTFADSYSSYTITLNDRNSTVGNSSVTVNSPYKLTVPTRSGYTFVGWFDAEENGTQYTDEEGMCLSVWSESENKTLYARWSLNYYTITYDCDEDVDLSGVPKVYTVEDEDFTLSEQYTVHSTLSWKLNNETIVSINTSAAKDITIKGVWTFLTASAPVEENRVEPSCTEEGHYDRVVYCEKCEEELSRETITIPPSSHSSTKELVCSVCGERVLYHREGNYIYFGEYPQTLKAESVTITSNQDSRGYYLGSDGFYYEKVVASPNSSGYTFSTGAEVIGGSTYYFKVEAIRWRIRYKSGENQFRIICDSIIANRSFDDSSAEDSYIDSDVRAWLNAEFYNTAFTELQRELVVTSVLPLVGYPEDKISLPSYAEVNSMSLNDRKKPTSDYSRATGVIMTTSGDHYGNGTWFLRDFFGYIDHSSYMHCAYGNGELGYMIVSRSACGIVPILTIRL